MELIGKIVVAVLGIAVTFVLLVGSGLIMAFPVKWTWNATMPYLFTLPVITWGKAWCLSFLCGCLIKSTTKAT